MTRARPPASFRLQGLGTLLTVFSPQSRAGFVSHRQRSWDSPFGGFPSRKVSAAFPPGRTHLPFSLAVHPPPESAGPARKASVPGFQPFRESLAALRGFSPPTAGSSPGFHPSRVRPQRPWPGFLPASSRTLRRPGSEPPNPPASQSIDRPLPDLLRKPRRSATAGQGDPHRVPAPVRSRAFKRKPTRAMNSPSIGPHITAGSPVVFG